MSNNIFNPLDYFENIAVNGIDTIKDKFYDESQKDFYDYFKIDKTIEVVEKGMLIDIVDVDNIPIGEELSIKKEYFKDHFEILLNEKAAIAIKEIRSHILKVSNLESKDYFLNEIIHRINNIKLKVSPNKSTNVTIFNNSLDYIIRLVSTDKSEEIKTTKLRFSEFKMSNINALFELLIELQFFESDSQKENFFKYIKSEKLDKGSITVNCSISEAAYIFRKMETFLSELNFNLIEQEQIFYNKHGKPFKQLSKSLNDFNKKTSNTSIIDNINTLFNEFQSSIKK